MFQSNHNKAFFLLRKENQEHVTYCTGNISLYKYLHQIPLKKYANDTSKPIIDSINLIPFCQAKERGFEVHDKGEKIKSLSVETCQYIPIKTVLEEIKAKKISLEDVSYNFSEIQYEQLVKQIIDKEIGQGQGANFVIPRRLDATLKGDQLENALAIFKSLLLNEYGAYWTYIFSDGQHYVVGASPERHISLEKNTLKMNPISGTFRKNHQKKVSEQSQDLSDFLCDEKEIFELFMVTDEELKMMCKLCEKGGQILGPYLKEMSQLIHTEYVLQGKTEASIYDIIKHSMYAPTVTGSPIENAFRIIKKYEKQSRSYYAATIALIGRDEYGEPFMDSPITIRTVELSQNNQFCAHVGATLVKSSNPTDEVSETKAKLAGVTHSINQAHLSEKILPCPLINENHLKKLKQRNKHLSTFWKESQHDQSYIVPVFKGKTILLIDFEDDFSLMLASMFLKIGFLVKRISWKKININDFNHDLIVFGPGPGNPCEKRDKKMKTARKWISEMIRLKKPFFAECLSHQILCNLLGFDIQKKTIPQQGIQLKIDLFGSDFKMGYYNTFAAISNAKILEKNPQIKISKDLKSNEIHALKAPFFQSSQFHPESILSLKGIDYIKDVCLSLLNHQHQ